MRNDSCFAVIVSAGLLGAAAGAANATMCYTGVPVRFPSYVGFEWHLIPAGAAHGGLLAALAYTGALLGSGRRMALRLLLALPVGWIAGYASGIPLMRSLGSESWLKAAAWCFERNGGIWNGIAPLEWFGLVALLQYMFLAFPAKAWLGKWSPVAEACLAGVLGSLWFWIENEHWQLSLLHGTLWGVAVGGGISRLHASSVVAATRRLTSG